MLLYLVAEVDEQAGVKVVTVTGQTPNGRFADGTVAIITKSAGLWQGRDYARLPVGWYRSDGQFLGTTLPPKAAIF